MDIQNFIDEFKHTFVYDLLSQTLADDQIFDHFVGKNGEIIWSREQMRQIWKFAKSQAVPDGFVLVSKDPTEEAISKMCQSVILGDDENGNPVYLSTSEANEAYLAIIESQEQSHD